MRHHMKIVYCTDFSENSRRAFGEAAFLARLTEGQLFVLHVIAGKYTAGEGLQKAEAALQHPDAPRALERLRTEFVEETEVPAEAALRLGNEPREMIEFAESVGADLIVIGARGEGALINFFGGGSITSKLVHNSPIPVLVVPHDT